MGRDVCMVYPPPHESHSPNIQHPNNIACALAASNVSDSQNQKSWTLYKMYCGLADGILMGTLRSESWGVYGGSNLVDLMSGLYDLITLDFFTVIKTKVYGKF